MYVGLSGGIFLGQSDAIIQNCLFYNNTSEGGSSAIDCWSSDPTILNCSFTDNNSPNWATIGMWNDASPHIANCILAYNNGYGLVFHYDANPTIQYNLLYQNSNGSFYGSVPANLGQINQQNANGTPCDLYFNICGEPQFDNINILDLHLLENSPCIDAGIPDTTALNLPVYDLDGNPRIVDGNGDGDAIIDMGCYEFPGIQ